MSEQWSKKKNMRSSTRLILHFLTYISSIIFCYIFFYFLPLAIDIFFWLSPCYRHFLLTLIISKKSYLLFYSKYYYHIFFIYRYYFIFQKIIKSIYYYIDFIIFWFFSDKISFISSVSFVGNFFICSIIIIYILCTLSKSRNNN